MAIQKKSLISSRTPEKKAATKQSGSVGETKSLTANAMERRTFAKVAKRAPQMAPRRAYKKY